MSEASKAERQLKQRKAEGREAKNTIDRKEEPKVKLQRFKGRR